MQLLDLAKNMEVQGKAYYLKLADDCPVQQLKGIFKFLASEEQHHFNIFDSIDKGEKTLTGSMESLKKAKEIFALLVSGFDMPEVIYDYEAAYRKALDMENESVRFYEEIKANLPDQQQIGIVDFIISQEKAHAQLMGQLIEFVKKPKEWLENSEWNHLDSY